MQCLGSIFCPPCHPSCTVNQIDLKGRSGITPGLMISTCFVLLGLTYHCLCVASLGHDCLWLSHSDEHYCICLWLVKHFNAFCGSRRSWKVNTKSISFYLKKKNVWIATARISLDIAFEIHLILTGTWNLPSFCLAPLRCPHLQLNLTVCLCNCNETNHVISMFLRGLSHTCPSDSQSSASDLT